MDFQIKDCPNCGTFTPPVSGFYRSHVGWGVDTLFCPVCGFHTSDKVSNSHKEYKLIASCLDIWNATPRRYLLGDPVRYIDRAY